MEIGLDRAGGRRGAQWDLPSRLVPQATDRFLVPGLSANGERSYGGELFGAAILAAGQTVNDGYRVHSAGAYFVAPGRTTDQTTYRTRAIRSGSSFATVEVEVDQGGGTIAVVMVSFQREPRGEPLFHQAPRLRAIASPEGLDVPPAVDQAAPRHRHLLSWVERHPVELRLVDGPDGPDGPDGLVGDGATEAHRTRIWLRLILPTNDEDSALTRAAGMAYLSDVFLLSPALGPHDLLFSAPGLHFATLDHGMWLHHDTTPGEWLLYDMESVWTGDDRALCRGFLFDRAGRLCASTIQEGLVRKTQDHAATGRAPDEAP